MVTMDALAAAEILMDLINRKDFILRSKGSTFKTLSKRTIIVRRLDVTIKDGNRVYHGSHCLNWLTDENREMLKEWFNGDTYPRMPSGDSDAVHKPRVVAKRSSRSR